MGYKAQMMNAFMNIKTAEKGLQFGAKKCKSMLIGKELKNVLNSKLSVDKWNVEHKENLSTGETERLKHTLVRLKLRNVSNKSIWDSYSRAQGII